MEVIILKASVVVFVMWAFYKLVLERESFFAANRIYLLSCLALAFIMPLILLPKLMSHQGYVDQLITNAISKNQAADVPTYTQSIDSKKYSLEEAELNSIVDESEVSAAKIYPANTVLPKATKPADQRGFSQYLWWLYLFGVAVLLLHLIAQVISLYWKSKTTQDKIEDDGAVIINLSEDTEPCSFFHYIFINPSKYDFDTYEQIIAHEKIHVDQKHSLDLLFSEFAVAIMWFNPFVWLLRREIEKNIEYQTDNSLVGDQVAYKEDYQMNLVQIACKTSPMAITTNYNQSLIKQRILRMNAKQSNKFSYWKYAFCAPLIFGLLVVLNSPYSASASPTEIDDNSKIGPLLNSLDSGIVVTDSVTISPLDAGTGKTKVISLTKSDDREVKVFVDCSELKSAIDLGKYELVKKLMSTVSPDCLKEIFDSKNDSEKKIEDKIIDKIEAKIIQNDNSANLKVDKTICDQLDKAVAVHDQRETRRILQYENISCLSDIYGDPFRDIDLMIGLLNYNASLRIDENEVIHISPISFIINIHGEKSACTDPNYLKLVAAIKSQNDYQIRKILTEEDLTCPLSTDGVTNDFIFIKKLMRLQPVITNENGEKITVGGLGFKIDLDKRVDKPKDAFNYEDNPFRYYKQGTNSEYRNDEAYEEKASLQKDCLSLIDVVQQMDFYNAKELLSEVEPNCYHQKTVTRNSPDGIFTNSEVFTPLIMATMMGNHAFVELLLENDADPNYTGPGKMTALMQAVESRSLSCVKELIKYKANVNAENSKGDTALTIAKKQKSNAIAMFLKENGAKE